MAPQRFRGLQEDSRSESSGTREKQLGAMASGVSKTRRQQGSAVVVGSNLKDVTAAPGSAAFQQNGHDHLDIAEKVSRTLPDRRRHLPLTQSRNQVQWTSFEVSVLNSYRQAHHLNTPAAFASSYNQYILTRPGIAASSPTMASHRDRRRASKESLTLAVRKDFNAAMTDEPETITSFLYTAQNRGRTSPST